MLVGFFLAINKLNVKQIRLSVLPELVTSFQLVSTRQFRYKDPVGETSTGTIMKKIICIALLSLIGCFAMPSSSMAEDAAAKHQYYEYAVVKWDGPDRLYINLPDNGFKLVHLEKEGVTIPKEADNEQFCLAVAANRMAKDGWEPINLDSRRILFRRPTVDVNGKPIKY